MFQALQKGWLPPDYISETEYKYLKYHLDENPHLSGFAGFACAFGGDWFHGYARNKKGDDSVSFALRGKNSILKKMETLKDAKFTSKDFVELDFENCLIYCDPPYKNTTPYNKQILGIFPYDTFLEWIREQIKKNIVLVSEYKHNVPEDATIVMEIPSRTSIRDKTGNVIDTIEVLYTYNQNLQQFPNLNT